MKRTNCFPWAHAGWPARQRSTRACRCGDRLERNHRAGGHGGAPRSHRHRRHRARAGRGARCRAGYRSAIRAVSRRDRGSSRRRAKGRRSAAIAAAAHDVLVGMYPAQATTLDTTYFNYLADKGLDGDPGILVGQQVAARILPLRRANPNPLPPPFVGGTGVGTWRPTPSFLGNPPAPAPFSPMATPWMADFDPFTLTSPTRFRAPPPPALTSDRYTRDYNEVKEIGSLASAKRTAEQTDLAYFYVRDRSGAVEPRAAGDCRAISAQERRHGPAVRVGESRDGRCAHHVLGQQDVLRRLAADHGDPGG